MTARRGVTSAALDPLRVELDRLAELGRMLRAELKRESEARRALAQERDGLLAELARRPRGGEGPDPGEVTLLRDKTRAAVRDRDTAVRELKQARDRHGALEAELAAARDDLAVAAEERACLEEQIRSLGRSLALLTAENRLLRADRRPAGTGSRGQPR
jgi:uncharacterized protein (DUF3084 family)